ncbi:uroporphyrinogen decarboxylase family protein [Clostridium sp.]|uniref:uroporphyrinogen decarboxylase family protein n=1 Tax=Clostridium sp. TaxID=1506 RepID=UPI001A5A28C2|nr:uroporphyrinogen decarboxylase family protein [Clostridium sp.]MBK5239892.1 uroporphyrinogen decarboxylase [Clostridium sp.]
MNREERIRAALNSEEVDRIPASVWMHFSEVDQDTTALAEAQVAFNERYDFDFIKLMPFGTYSIQDWGAKIKIYCDKYKEPIVEDRPIKSINDWNNLEVLPAVYGTWGKQLQLAQKVSKLRKKHTPIIQTIFSPFSTARKLAGDRIFNDMKENPKILSSALEVIAQTTKNFIKENINAGVDGFFLATQTASYDLMDDISYKNFCEYYDLKVIDSYKDRTYFNTMHIHGDNIMFNTIKNYPGTCLNWHDRYAKPDFAQARQLTGKCFLGGIKEVPYFVDGVLHYNSILLDSNPEQIEKHVTEAIKMVDGKGLIIGPGCVCDPKTADENLYAVRRAADNYSKSDYVIASKEIDGNCYDALTVGDSHSESTINI